MKEYTSDLQLRNVALETAHVSRIELGFGDDHDQLSESLVVGHGAVDRVDPAVHLFAVGLAEQVRFVLRRSCGRHEGQAKSYEQGE